MLFDVSWQLRSDALIVANYCVVDELAITHGHTNNSSSNTLIQGFCESSSVSAKCFGDCLWIDASSKVHLVRRFLDLSGVKVEQWLR